jgi:hypothetical protein
VVTSVIDPDKLYEPERLAELQAAEERVDAALAHLTSKHKIIYLTYLYHEKAKLTTYPIIEPSQTTSNTVYTIGHSAKSTTENFNTYAAFIAQLQTELTGGTLATGMTAVGPYTTSSYTLEATSITVFLNN